MSRILNCTKLTITRLIKCYRVTGRTSSTATGLGHFISRRTVRRRLRQHAIGAYRPFRGMTLTRQHRLRHLRWARQFQRWQHRNWQRVFFSDESRFQLYRADGGTRIYRRAGERTAPCCVQETVPSGGGSVMVWGGICGQQRTDRIVIDGNVTALRYLHMVDIHAIETCSF